MGALLLLGASALVALGNAPLDDSELAQMRGGFVLPNGIEIGLALQTSAMADHQLILTSTVDMAQADGTIAISARKEAGAPNEATLQVDPQSVRYAMQGLTITQRIGGAMGTVVENSVDNRTLFVASTLTVTIGNLDTGSIGGFGAAIGRLTNDLAAVRQ